MIRSLLSHHRPNPSAPHHALQFVKNASSALVSRSSSISLRSLHSSSIVSNNNSDNSNDPFLVSPPPSSASRSGLKDATRSVIVQLLQNIGSKKEVEQYLKYYSSIDTTRFAVIKIGGGVLLEEMDTLVSSVSFLFDCGLTPVIIHGAGPQLNDTLRAKGIESDYIGGMRITTPEILRTARQVFLKENTRLVDALEAKGTRARGITTGVFEAEFLDKERFQLVGQVTKVDVSQVYAALEQRIVPVLTCVGESPSGQILNINADVAAHELAKELRPVKIIYLSSNGGIKDKDGKLMHSVDLETEYETLMVQPWFKHGDRLKLKEIKQLLDALPLSSSVAVTSASNLPKELFTHKGSGTLIRRSEKIHTFTSFDGIDLVRLQNLIETSFGGRLVPGYLESIRPNIHRIYLSDSYRACAVITKDPNDPNASPYLDKFAVTKAYQAEGVGQLIWNKLRTEIHRMFWRSRAINPINPWYFEHSDGAFTHNEWTCFWFGFDNLNHVQPLIDKALARPHTIDRSKPVGADDFIDVANRKPFSTVTRAHAAAAAAANATTPLQSAPSRSFSSSASSAASASKKITRLGLIGARGHTGSELIKILARHPHVQFVSAGSRALAGQLLTTQFDSVLPADSPIRQLKFTDVQPKDIANRNDVDVWILALPNDAAKPYVDALADRKDIKLIDLSADYRFTSSWAYGFPERHGNRPKIISSTRISNPGCYATGTQVSLLPIADLIDHDHKQLPYIFGISGYSGAGTTPSRKNDLTQLKDNLMPYSLVNHMHEREVSYQLSSVYPHGVRFMPHVAPWFRGISLTVALTLHRKVSKADLLKRYQEYYAGEPLIHVQEDIPEVRDIQNRHHVTVGGFTIDNDKNRLVVCATIDNLLKGAATQAVQNLNLIQGYNETTAILDQK